MAANYFLTLTCEDRIGLVAEVSGFLSKQGCNILESQQFDDLASNRFFMRVAFSAPGEQTAESISADFSPLAAATGMRWTCAAMTVACA